MINVSFIPFFVFGFWSLLATKLRKYENITNITQSLFTFCKTEKTGKKITQLKWPKHQKPKIWDEAFVFYLFIRQIRINHFYEMFLNLCIAHPKKSRCIILQVHALLTWLKNELKCKWVATARNTQFLPLICQGFFSLS